MRPPSGSPSAGTLVTGAPPPTGSDHPSSAGRWLACGASPALRNRVSLQRDSPYWVKPIFPQKVSLYYAKINNTKKSCVTPSAYLLLGRAALLRKVTRYPGFLHAGCVNLKNEPKQLPRGPESARQLCDLNPGRDEGRARTEP